MNPDFNPGISFIDRELILEADDMFPAIPLKDLSSDKSILDEFLCPGDVIFVPQSVGLYPEIAYDDRLSDLNPLELLLDKPAYIILNPLLELSGLMLMTALSPDVVIKSG
jgi:hypothetical protein